MRFTVDCPSPGQCRVVSKFLWFPKTILKDQRWLERASWTEQYTYIGFGNGDGVAWWKSIHWGGTEYCGKEQHS